MTETCSAANPTPRYEHDVVEPAILYWGTPVILISTVSESNDVNLMPMSSAFWLGQNAILGLGKRSKTFENLIDVGECVLNLPSADMADMVDRLALTTGRDPVPAAKYEAGYRLVKDKFARAGVTPVPSDTVRPPRVAECPVNMEARVVATSPIADDDPANAGYTAAVEVHVTRIHVHPQIRLPGYEHRIDPDTWRPLIMSFQQFYGLGPRLRSSRLASIDEEYYR
ncbi:flavin reductase family protein [Gryllotalpicola koreensis]|uniref:Flavin reductase family protein n=2 Tax=Gryllotalpicola koreensis TaxID=993086 RepID=A0ABP7ZQT0_9MICO